MTGELRNKVEESGIITLNLEDFYPKEETIAFDLKEYLFMDLILKEKEYRARLNEEDWSRYKNKNVYLYCSTDAIIPIWAYMLATSYLQPIAANVVFGNKEKLIEKLLLANLQQINVEEYINKRVVVKGCGEKKITEIAYVEITNILRPVVKSIMYGEPCSTVPIYKKKL